MKWSILLLTSVLTFCIFAIVLVNGKTGYGPGEQDWGYIDVRPGAHMFYWLYYTTAKNIVHYTERPLAIWLQGGPGASSTGYGNFDELGPLTIDGKSRNWTWVKDMNVLFIDNPVGTGFSYVDNETALTRNNHEIALDLVTFMKGFNKLHPEFTKVPLHIFCESYGGKMAPEFALELYYAKRRGEIQCNLKSVVLGDPWTSPIDSVLAWGPLLLNMGIVDYDGYEEIMEYANATLKLVKSDKWYEATQMWGETQSVVVRVTKGVNFYNIATPTKANGWLNRKDLMHQTLLRYDGARLDDSEWKLQNLMTGPVSEALNITGKRWGSQSSLTFNALQNDFMKPAIRIVDELLNKTDLQVGVLSGQLDLICATLGAVNWIEKMQWPHKFDYSKTPRKAITVNKILEGYEKTYGNFSMFWINRAGHMVPADNPNAMSYILKKYTKYDH